MSKVQKTEEEIPGFDEEEEPPRQLQVSSKDGVVFDTNTLELSLSGLYMTSLDCEPNAPLLTTPNVNGETLALIMSYLKHHNGVPTEEIPKPLREGDFSKICKDPWDLKFIEDLEDHVLAQVIIAANYLDVKPLLELSCAKVATLIRGKSPENIKAALKNFKKPVEESD